MFVFNSFLNLMILMLLLKKLLMAFNVGERNKIVCVGYFIYVCLVSLWFLIDSILLLY